MLLAGAGGWLGALQTGGEDGSVAEDQAEQLVVVEEETAVVVQRHGGGGVS